MTMTAVPAQNIQQTARQRGADACAAELDALLTLARTLAEADWAKPTDCTEWTVRDLLAHVLGQFEGAASLRVFFRRYRTGHRRYPDRTRLDAMTQQQVDNLSHYSPAILIDKLAITGPKAIRVSRRMPGLVRRINGSRMFPDNPLHDPTLAYLVDVIYARDTWMHRVDIACATGRSMTHGAHEQKIVAQVVRELHATWTGPPIVLELTGPTGGTWSVGTGRPVATVRADTVDYLRMISGRDAQPDLDIDGDQSVVGAATAARVVF